jgi:hypothetical protein
MTDIMVEAVSKISYIYRRKVPISWFNKPWGDWQTILKNNTDGGMPFTVALRKILRQIVPIKNFKTV